MFDDTIAQCFIIDILLDLTIPDCSVLFSLCRIRAILPIPHYPRPFLTDPYYSSQFLTIPCEFEYAFTFLISVAIP